VGSRPWPTLEGTAAVASAPVALADPVADLVAHAGVRPRPPKENPQLLAVKSAVDAMNMTP